MWPGRPAARCRTSSARAEHAMARAEQERRVEVALDGAVGAELLPGDVERHAPVDADDVAAGRGEVGQDRRRAGAEMNRRHAGRLQGGEDLGGVRAARTRGSRRPTARRPTSRKSGSPGRPLRPARRRTSLTTCGQPVAQPVPRLGVAVHQRLGAGEVARRPALDGVRRQRERRAGEADERDAAVELAARHGGSRRARSRAPSRGSNSLSRSMSASVRSGCSTRGPSPLTKSKAQAHRLEAAAAGPRR